MVIQHLQVIGSLKISKRELGDSAIPLFLLWTHWTYRLQRPAPATGAHRPFKSELSPPRESAFHKLRARAAPPSFLAFICSPSNRSIEPSIARLQSKPFQSGDRAVQTAARHLRRVLELPALLEHRCHLDGPVAVVIVRVLGGHRAAPDEGRTRWQLVAIAAGNFEAISGN